MYIDLKNKTLKRNFLLDKLSELIEDTMALREELEENQKKKNSNKK
jgi:hypothetical protein